MLIQTLIVIAVSVLVAMGIQTFGTQAAKVSTAMTKQTSINVIHEKAIVTLNNTRGWQNALGLANQTNLAVDMTGVNQNDQSATNVHSLNACLGGVGTGCLSYNGAAAALPNGLAASSTFDAQGASPCQSACTVSQVVTAKYACSSDTGCESIAVEVDTVDSAAPTKYSTLKSEISISARSLLNRGEINFVCSGGSNSFFIKSVDFKAGQANCGDISFVNSTGGVNVPARTISAVSAAAVQNPPGLQSCAGQGFSRLSIYASQCQVAQ